MKKILILLLSVVPLLFTSCFGLWGPHEEDIRTWLAGNIYVDGKCLETPNICFEGNQKEVLGKPFIKGVWKTTDDLLMKVFVSSENTERSFTAECFISDNPNYKKYGQELMDNSVFVFTYYPEDGEPVEISFSGNELIASNKYSFCFTLDFDTKTVYPNELK